MRLWKVTDERSRSMHGGTGRWTPGRWRSVSGTLVPCERGLHLCRDEDLVRWLGPVIWTAETSDPEPLIESDRVVVNRARVLTRVEAWTKRTQRLFAAWCAEQALSYARPEDRPTLEATIAVVRRYADGLATDAELAAARSAADAAAGSPAETAWAAAEAAAWAAAQSAWAAVEAAADSAPESAWAAAQSAWAAAEAAADSAAGAAWSARSAAGSAARSAAWSAAQAAAEAAWSPAESAARRDQTAYLLDLLGVDR